MRLNFGAKMIVRARHLHREHLCHYNLIWQKCRDPLGKCLAKFSSFILNGCQAPLLSENYFTCFLHALFP